ncbi:hypothetical protein D8Z79_025850 (plasmid) [Escherichia fergusonii]|uniref:hypothetical protein n=2 Tax=Escherichia fergusonii TaxID=564 RepID=UPI00111A73F6|nr:hypothetical protein [Escherichia fergusonii]QCZ35068.1 hypothetical protein D8Z79_025850 [Escherichia fergusonii]
MKKIEDNFNHKGVTFKILKRGKNAIMLDAKADFYNCASLEVWQIRKSKERTIKGKVIPAHEIKPGNEDYPFTAHQFMRNHFKTEDEFQDIALKDLMSMKKGSSKENCK